jgi:hypothetical protein
MTPLLIPALAALAWYHFKMARMFESIENMNRKTTEATMLLRWLADPTIVRREIDCKLYESLPTSREDRPALP